MGTAAAGQPVHGGANEAPEQPAGERLVDGRWSVEEEVQLARRRRLVAAIRPRPAGRPVATPRGSPVVCPARLTRARPTWRADVGTRRARAGRGGRGPRCAQRVLGRAAQPRPARRGRGEETELRRRQLQQRTRELLDPPRLIQRRLGIISALAPRGRAGRPAALGRG
eukprot:scaffold29074_cov109-Isochrysis_galbana.AAC.5